MKATEVFKLFLKDGLEPNERLAFTTELRIKIRLNHVALCHHRHLDNDYLTPQDFEKDFIERLANFTQGIFYRPACCSLSSVMKNLLIYVPSIIGNSRKPNKFLARYDLEIPKGVGHKKYWETRFIKKWHDFLKENVINYDKMTYCLNLQNYCLKEG